MADPICRWRNATPETICEIIEQLPKKEMSEDEFRQVMLKSKWGESFNQTVYQLACQTALYYIDDNHIYHPRFSENITKGEAEKYLHHWFHFYYIPNPYTRKGFNNLKKPQYFERTLFENLQNQNSSDDFSKLLNETFKDEIGELDILKNLINRYSDFLKVEDNKIKIEIKGKQNMEINVDRNDKKSFFDSFNENNSTSSFSLKSFFQTIFYGVPGSGKSHKIKEILQNELNISNIENQVVRTVFHPEYTNADFVGQILPNVKDGQVQYKFTPGPFSIILKKALLDCKNNYALIIEEINRGNAAAIFGELFQLLDRLEKNQKDEIGGNTYTAGWSEYFVMNSSVNEFVRDAVGEDEKATKALDLFDGSIHFSSNTGIRLPPNLSIFATMNTSDQNVFKLDNAFKRRWDLVLIQNEFGETDDEIHQRDAQVEGFDFTWEQFRKAANKIITEENDTDSFSDKQLGCWFAKAERISDEEKQFIIPRKLFADKVLEYLWDDVFSFDEGIFFNIANYKTFADVAKSVEDKSKTIKIEDLFSKSFCDEIAKIKNQPGENPADSETSSKMTVAGE